MIAQRFHMGFHARKRAYGLGGARIARVRQTGAALLISLIFVALLGTTLAAMVAYDAYRTREREALVSGYEAYEIGRAARLYVRDRFKNDPTLRMMASTPQLVTLTTLRNNGYLPADFGRGTGGNEFTALNQNVHVIMTNWPIAGSPTADTTVPTAFVFFRNGSNGRATPQLSASSVRVLRNLEANISAPTFNSAGTLTTLPCRGAGPAVSQWDTGCLTSAEFSLLVNALPSGQRPSTFEPGSLMLPAWKIMQPDQRAVMRYAQPENPGHSTMLTDLKMGTPRDSCNTPATQLQINTTDSAGNRVTVPSGLCDMLGDGVRSATDNDRFNITGVANMAMQRMIVAPQNVDRVSPGEPAADLNYEYAMSVSGATNLTGDLRIYSDIPLPNSVENAGRPASHRLNHRLNIPNGTLVTERNVYAFSTTNTSAGEAHIGQIERARRLVSDGLTTPIFNAVTPSLHTTGTPGAPMMNVTTTTTLRNNMNVTNATGTEGELITEVMRAQPGGGRIGATLTTTDTHADGNVQIGGTLNTQGGPTNINVTNNARLVDGQYIAVIGQISNGGTVDVTNPTGITGLTDNTMISVNSTRDYTNTPMNTINVHRTGNLARCRESNIVANGCPNRQYVPPGISP